MMVEAISPAWIFPAWAVPLMLVTWFLFFVIVVGIHTSPVWVWLLFRHNRRWRQYLTSSMGRTIWFIPVMLASVRVIVALLVEGVVFLSGIGWFIYPTIYLILPLEKFTLPVSFWNGSLTPATMLLVLSGITFVYGFIFWLVCFDLIRHSITRDAPTI